MGRHYLIKLPGDQVLTDTRNIILEIMEGARNNQFKKSGLVAEIQRVAEANGVEIIDDTAELNQLISNICILKSNNRNYALK